MAGVRAVVGVGPAGRRGCSRRWRWPGRPQGKTITTAGHAARARCSRRPRTSSPAPSGRWASREINTGHRRGHVPAAVPSPVREDGPGWRAEVDLPYGVTATQVIERREQLASGLRRPLGAVWPEPVTSEHAGRLELWVGRADVAKAKPAPWPLAARPAAATCSRRSRSAPTRAAAASTAHVIEHNWLLGLMPGQGKTVGRPRAGLPPSRSTRPCEMWMHELKGSGDLDPFEQVCHRFVSGIDDESIGYAAESLQLLRAEVMQPRRAAQEAWTASCARTRRSPGRSPPSASPAAVPAVAASSTRRRTCSPTRSTASSRRATPCSSSRSAGRSACSWSSPPSGRTRQSLPTGVSGNVSTRFCLKVAGPGRERHDPGHLGVQERGPGDHVPAEDRRRARLPARARAHARRSCGPTT